MFAHIAPYAGDPILTLNEDFQKDPRKDKINLSIGIYFDDAGRIPVMASVQRAEAVLAGQVGPKPYLPMEGAANFRSVVPPLLWGEGHPAIAAGRIATMRHSTVLNGAGVTRTLSVRRASGDSEAIA